jgi:HlyD family secretion protein
MSAVGNSDSATSIVRPDPALLDPSTRPHAPARSLFDQTDGSGTDRTNTNNSRGGFGRAVRTLLGLLIAVGLIGGGVWAAMKYALPASNKAGPVALTHQVVPTDFVVTITEDGNVESASNIDIRCLVAGGGTIKEIVNDGTIVNQGDKLVEIDSAVIDEQILTQKIGFEKARAIRDQAKNDLEAAKISLREYVEGTYKKEQQAVDSQITVAEENMRSAQNTLLYTERMFRKGYVTPLQLESQQFAVKRSGLDLETAKTAKRVLEEFTYAKMKNDLETLVATAGAKATSEQAAYELEESKLKRLETQKLNCIIVAPQAGMVVYANESSGGGRMSSDRPKIEEGAVVRESQVILRVPDLTQMQVRATVHESKVESLRRDMRASVVIQNRKLTGYVTSVANQPEPTSWGTSPVKKYATYVRIDGVQDDLKPGMTAKVEILIDERKGALTVPVQCVVEQGGKFYAWRTNGAASEKTEVKLGLGDDRQVEVVSGLAKNDLVLQNPPEKSTSEFSGTPDMKQFGDGPRPSGAKPGDAGPTAAGPNAGGPSAGGPGAGGARPRVDIMSHDANKDGKVSLDEAPEQVKPFFSRIDADADGYVTTAEAAAARAKRQAQGAGGPGGPSGGNQ